MLIFDRTELRVDKPVLWTRGRGCRELATVLSDAEPVRVQGDLVDTCVEHRAELLVSRRLASSSDFISGASPIDFEPERIRRVVATVAGGPHSVLAAQVAARLGIVLDAPTTMVSAHRSEHDQGAALATIEAIAGQVGRIEYRLVEADGMADMVEQFAPGTLLVLGAPGGGWLRRMFLGPGAKLRSEATTGAVVVRAAPQRAFQAMDAPVFVGPMLRVEDLLRTHVHESVVAVVDDGVLVGVVVLEDVADGDVSRTVGEVMVPTQGIGLMETVEDLQPPRRTGAAEPVVDDDGRLVGALRR